VTLSRSFQRLYTIYGIPSFFGDPSFFGIKAQKNYTRKEGQRNKCAIIRRSMIPDPEKRFDDDKLEDEMAGWSS
jgi:hypothetical protein